MESIVIVVPRIYDEAILARLRSAGFDKTSEDCWAMEDTRGRVYVSLDDWTEAELGLERLTYIKEKINDPVFYGVDFSDIQLCREVIQVLADDPRMLIDNDHGTILPGSEFARRVRSKPEWDWRRE